MSCIKEKSYFPISVLLVITVFAIQKVCLAEQEKEFNKNNRHIDSYAHLLSLSINGSIETLRKAIYRVNHNRVKRDIYNHLYLDEPLMNMSTLHKQLRESTKDMGKRFLISSLYSQIVKFFKRIDNTYTHFSNHKIAENSINDSAVHHFLNKLRDPYDGPLLNLDLIYEQLVPNNANKRSIIFLLKKDLEGYENICDRNMSLQQIFYILLENIAVTEMRVWFMMQHCYKQLAEVHECDYAESMNNLRKLIGVKGSKIRKRILSILKTASREVWRCDPWRHVEGITYAKLNDVFQKYIIKDEDMNNEKSCYKGCDDFDEAVATKCVNRENEYDAETGYNEQSICDQQRKCSGILHNCVDYFKGYNKLWICPSYSNSTRRYEFLQLEDDYKLGQKNASKNDCNRKITYDYRSYGNRAYDWLRECDICVCTCDDSKSPQSDRLINIIPSVADKDYVVTGVRLVKQNRTLHLQIEQGKLLSEGRVDEASVHWKEIDPPTTEFDTVEISYENNNQIYLGVQEVPKDHVIIGLKFSQMHKSQLSTLALMLMSRPYNYTTGEFVSDHEYYQGTLYDRKSNQSENYSRPFFSQFNNKEIKVDIEYCDLPIKTKRRSIPQSETKKVVKFTTTDFEKDLGQNTIPFIDIQSVFVRPPVPLTGIGFYHKNRSGYGGFLGLKLLTYDVYSHSE